MYYVAFFPDFRPLVLISLIRLLENSIDNAWINYNGKIAKFTLENLPPDLDNDYISAIGEVKLWHIYEKTEKNYDDDDNFKFPPLNPISLEEIDTFYQYLSQKYSWSFFPWGSVGSFFGFAFVSSNKYIRDRLIDIVNNLYILIKYPNTPDRQPRCISSYDVAQNLSESIQCIVFDINSYWLGMRVWKLAEQIDSYQPLIIINNLNYSLKEDLSDFILSLKVDNDTFFQFNDDSNTNINSNLSEVIKITDEIFWDNFDGDIPDFFQKECKKIARAKCFEKSGEAANVFDIEQWNNQIYFNQVCRYYGNFIPLTEIIIPFPKMGTFKAIENILAIIETSKYGTSDDLIMMPELLNQTEWFMGINRLLENGYQACIFMSKNNNIIQRLNHINYDDDFSLITCF